MMFLVTVALYGFPILSWWLFKKYDAPKAAILCFMIALLYLPSGEGAFIRIPLFVSVERGNIAGLCIFAILLLTKRRWLASERFGRGPEFFAILGILGRFGTYITNPDPIVYGRFAGMIENAKLVVLPGIGIKDCFADIIGDMVYIIIPFFVGRAVFKTERAVRTLLFYIAAMSLPYILLMMIELRTSPQIHTWVYGYYPHPMFGQSMRWGGWRPQVFMYHGLPLATFMVMTFLSVTALDLAGVKKIWSYSTKKIAKISPIFVIMGKSTGPLFYMLIFGVSARFLSHRAVARILCVFAVIVVVYFYLQGSAILDVDAIYREIGKYSEERAGSLLYRFRNELELSNRVRDKALFGWGSYGRAHIFDEDTGTDLTVLDGYWISRYSYYGIFGLFTPYFLLLGPTVVFLRRLSKIRDEGVRSMLMVLVCMVVVYSVDSIPNSGGGSLAFLFSGAAWGAIANLSSKRSPAPG